MSEVWTRLKRVTTDQVPSAAQVALNPPVIQPAETEREAEPARRSATPSGDAGA